MNFQESTTILNACTKKKSVNLLKAPRIYENNIQTRWVRNDSIWEYVREFL